MATPNKFNTNQSRKKFTPKKFRSTPGSMTTPKTSTDQKPHVYPKSRTNLISEFLGWKVREKIYLLLDLLPCTF
jgi:hypothetical protein